MYIKLYQYTIIVIIAPLTSFYQMLRPTMITTDPLYFRSMSVRT